MTDPIPARPLVTFALFAYNQEQYIREAVEGAFSQTYEPLEIILSDDCSSDRTFEIMQEMAAAYQGPHEVWVRRSVVNRGTLGHLFDVANEATGVFLVVAAGDDISLPERTAALIKIFSDDIFLAGSSDDQIIDQNGDSLKPEEERISRRDKWHALNPSWIHGATAVYRLAFLKELPDSPKKLLFEDMILSDIIGGIGAKTFRTRKKLIKYRYHTLNISSRHEKNIDETEAAAIERWRQASDAKAYCVSTLLCMKEIDSHMGKFLETLQIEHDFFYHLSKWRKLKIAGKVKLLKLSFYQKNFRTAAIRVFGFSFFKFIRHAQQSRLWK